VAAAHELGQGVDLQFVATDAELVGTGGVHSGVKGYDSTDTQQTTDDNQA
jgi:hypothetical protein